MKILLVLLFISPVSIFAQNKKILPAASIENVLGYWFVPHGAVINIRFTRDKHFIFNDYNSVLDKDEKLTGTFTLKGSILTLLYDDRPQQKFRFYRGAGNDNNFYIESFGKREYYFVKGENGDGKTP